MGAAAAVAAAATRMEQATVVPSLLPRPTRAELLAVYGAGPEAVIALVGTIVLHLHGGGLTGR